MSNSPPIHRRPGSSGVRYSPQYLFTSRPSTSDSDSFPLPRMQRAQRRTVVVDASPYTPVQTTTILAILAFGAVILLFVLLCMVLCYRRKSVPEEDDCEKRSVDSIPEPSQNRSISFGTMPSWREERQKRHNNRHVFGALDRIREVDERSRGSGSMPSQNGSVNGSNAGSAVSSLASGRSYLSEGHAKHSQLHLFRPREAARRCYSTSQLRTGEVFAIDAPSPAYPNNVPPQRTYPSRGGQRARASDRQISEGSQRMRASDRQRRGSAGSIPVQIDGPSPSYPLISPRYPSSLPSPLYPVSEEFYEEQPVKHFIF